MDDILKEISSPAWWFTVILVGLLINLAAAYLKPRLDATASLFSKSWADRSAKRRANLERLVQAVAEDAAVAEYVRTNLTVQLAWAVLYFVVAVVVIVLIEADNILIGHTGQIHDSAKNVLYSGLAASMLLGMESIFKALDYRRTLFLAAWATTSEGSKQALMGLRPNS